MRSKNTKKRSSRFFGRLVRCEQGGADGPLIGTLMTVVGLALVNQLMPAVQESGDTAGKALRNQASVLSRGSQSGAMGGSGFDIGSFTGMASQFGSQVGSLFGQFSQLGEKFGEFGEKFGDKNGDEQSGSGQVSGVAPGGTTPPATGKK